MILEKRHWKLYFFPYFRENMKRIIWKVFQEDLFINCSPVYGISGAQVKLRLTAIGPVDPNRGSWDWKLVKYFCRKLSLGNCRRRWPISLTSGYIYWRFVDVEGIEGRGKVGDGWFVNDLVFCNGPRPRSISISLEHRIQMQGANFVSSLPKLPKHGASRAPEPCRR